MKQLQITNNDLTVLVDSELNNIIKNYEDYSKREIKNRLLDLKYLIRQYW